MLKDKDFDELTKEIVEIYNQLEAELLIDVSKRFSTYTSVAGSLEWYLEMLNNMKALDDNAVKVISKLSGRSDTYIKKMLKEAQFGNFNKSDYDKAYKQGMTKISYDNLIKNQAFKKVFESSYKEINESLRLIQTKALESTKQAYMDVLNKTYVSVASGTYSYDQAIRKGIDEMAIKGITGATYKRKDGTIVNYSIEAVVRRDTLGAVHKIANETSMESILASGNNYVDVSSHLGARINFDNPIANHAGWQGKQYQIVGESKEYPNFIKATGYGDILGFGGVNCRHRIFNFFPNISKPFANEYNEDENRMYYENTQRLRKLERDMRSLKKRRDCLKEIDDLDGVKKLNKRIKNKSGEIDKLCDTNNIKRDFTREVLS